MEGDDSIPDTEWAAMISEAYGELYTIVTESGMEYFESSTQYTTAGVNTLTEPTDILFIVQLLFLADAPTGRYISLRPLMMQERAQMSGLTLTMGSRATAYVFVNRTIYLYPTPPSGQVYELRYVAQPAELTGASTSIDVVTPDGLTFLIWNVATMAAAKIESDPQLALQRLEAARERFTESVTLRALNQPRHRVADIESENVDWSNYWSW